MRGAGRHMRTASRKTLDITGPAPPLPAREKSIRQSRLGRALAQRPAPPAGTVTRGQASLGAVTEPRRAPVP